MSLENTFQQQLARLQRGFTTRYGASATLALRAPARISLLGDHVDYVPYMATGSLIFGSGEYEMVMLVRPRDDGQVCGMSTRADFAPFAFAADAGPREQAQTWEEWLYGQAAPAPDWANYVRGAVYFARMKYQVESPRGFDLLVDSRIPPKGGSSSSSALVSLAGAAFRIGNDIAYQPYELAMDSAQAEWYVGTRGGAMDHLAICMSAPGTLLNLRYTNHEVRPVRLGAALERLRFVTFFSQEADKGREIMLAYNERAAVSRLLIPALLRRPRTGGATLKSRLEQLPETMTRAEIKARAPGALIESRALFPALGTRRGAAPLKIRVRALHHLGETQRVTAALGVLAEHPLDAAARLGALVDAAHASLRDLYEISTPEVEYLRDVMRRFPGVYGARIMGGGFGGNVLALIDADNASGLIEHVQNEYYAPRLRHGLTEGAVMVSTPGHGLSVVR
ncbi:MAG: galactokinase family protein [Blastocatellia bacterium]